MRAWTSPACAANPGAPWTRSGRCSPIQASSECPARRLRPQERLDGDSSQGAAPLRLEERQDTESDQPECDENEEPGAEIGLSERAEDAVDAFGAGRLVGNGRVDGGDSDAGHYGPARDVTGLAQPDHRILRCV